MKLAALIVTATAVLGFSASLAQAHPMHHPMHHRHHMMHHHHHMHR
jgi:hypothetical protein